MNVNVITVSSSAIQDEIHIFFDYQKAFAAYLEISIHLGVEFPDEYDTDTTPIEDYLEVTEAHLDNTDTSISWRWITIDDAEDYTITKKG
jgi:hypothetical protein